MHLRKLAVILVVGAGVGLSGCSSSTGGAGGGSGGSAGGGSGGAGGGTGGAGGGTGGAGGGTGGGSAGAGCPAYSATDATHHLYGSATSTPIITADETWKADHVYFVMSTFTVRGCTLTIEAGARVCLGKGSGSTPTIFVDENGATEGKVLINGTAARPVVFDRATPTDVYSGFQFTAQSQARFDQVVFRNGGNGGQGVLNFAANHLHAAVLRNVHLESFFSSGLSVRHPLGLSADSTLFVDSQQAAATAPVLRTSIAAFKTFSAASLKIAGTIPAATRVIAFTDADVSANLTLSNVFGAPFFAEADNLIVRRLNAGDPIPTLTVEAGTTVRFNDGKELIVGDTGTGGEGNLTVNGTAASPVVFTSATTPAARGLWSGVTFYAGGAGTAVLHYLQLENAGGPAGANLINCRSPVLADAVQGALKLLPVQTQDYAGPTIDNLKVLRSGGDGIAFKCVALGCLTTDYTSAITGSDNQGVLVRALGCN